jgi:hypothetical protein
MSKEFRKVNNIFAKRKLFTSTFAVQLILHHKSALFYFHKIFIFFSHAVFAKIHNRFSRKSRTIFADPLSVCVQGRRGIRPSCWTTSSPPSSCSGSTSSTSSVSLSSPTLRPTRHLFHNPQSLRLFIFLHLNSVTYNLS